MVARYPDRVAVDALDRAIGYAELDRYANAIAAALVANFGDGAEPVPLLMEQKIPFMAAMLGAMKARKSFSPLDPVYPPERLAQVLEDLDARVVLTDAAHAALAAEAVERLNGPKPLLLDVAPLESEALDSGPSISPSPSDLAWITFTSGSTGRPKGVTQNHANASYMSKRYSELASISKEDRLTLLHPALTWDIFGALLCGATLCPYDLRAHGVAGVGAWVRQRGVTLYRSFPTTYRQVMATLSGDEMSGVRLVHLSGETVSRPDVELFRRSTTPGAILLVLFGSGEGGVMTAEKISHETEVGDAVPVGRPLPGVEIAFVDENLQPTPAGEAGEICVRSQQLFSGYWKRPELTEAAFVSLAGGSTRPFFRTGDMGRLDEVGRVLYSGRRDSQVKIRGYRVELGEIEAALQSYPAVRHAAARTFDRADGDKRLVGYFVADSADVTERGVQRFLEGRLPVAMVPDRLIRLDVLPQTANGKTDRKALPPPPRSRPVLETPFVASRTPLEHEIAEIFCEILELDEIGVRDSFFALGGKSLGAVRVLAALSKRWNVRISPRGFFEAATVAQTAERVSNPDAAANVDLAELLDEIEGLSERSAEILLEAWDGGVGAG